MRTILVTGATGFLGHNLVKALAEDTSTKVIAILGRPEDKANSLPQRDNIDVYPCSDLFTRDFGHVDTLIHTAFSRGDNLAGLTSSINLTAGIIELVNRQGIDSIINISTQGIYKGLHPGERVTEKGVVEPNTAYGLTKWAVENMFRLGCRKTFTHIRMASLSSNARFLDFFVESVMKGRDIIVTSPNQYASIMDVKDAVNGIRSVTDLPIEKRACVYNLGPGVQHSILEYAEAANKMGQLFGFTPVSVRVDDSGKAFAICMDCSTLMAQTHWKPEITMQVMLWNMFNSKNQQI